jgi:tRNA threonylcarbamoyladenosine biosynthesis protein TsaE
MKKITINNITALGDVVAALIDFAQGRKKILLIAPMGAGKTTFVKAFCQYLGVVGDTSSPTFSLVNEYDYSKGIIRHLDLYRLKKVEEAIDFGIEDYFYDAHYLLIEWPEILAPILPNDLVVVKIEVDEQQRRHFTFQTL